MLDAIVDNRKKNCFQKSDGAFCGNKIVEVGEECDCGFDDAECQETCCYPRLVLLHFCKLLGWKLACGRHTLKFSFSEKAIKICAIYLMVLTFTTGYLIAKWVK